MAKTKFPEKTIVTVPTAAKSRSLPCLWSLIKTFSNGFRLGPSLVNVSFCGILYRNVPTEMILTFREMF